MTKAYRLPCKNIIHTVGPVWHGGGHNEARLLASCYDTALRLAESHHLRSIAFPCISTGAYGYPKEKAAQIALDTICRHIERKEYNGDVIICCFKRDNADIYENILRQRGILF